MHLESVLSIGVLKGGGAHDPVAFTGCTFKFPNPPSVDPALEAWSVPRMLSFTNITFTGCRFFSDDNTGWPIVLYLEGPQSTFVGCSFIASALSSDSLLVTTVKRDRIRYIGCTMSDPRGTQRLTDVDQYEDLANTADVTRKLVAPSTFISRRKTPAEVLWAGGWYDDPFLGNITMVPTTEGHGTIINSTAAAQVHVGDVIWTTATSSTYLSSSYPVGGYVGRVSAVAEDTIALDLVSEVYKTGAAGNMWVYYWRRWHDATRGDLMAGSPIIQNVNQVVDWFPGLRISGAGVPYGAFVTDRSATPPYSLTMSANATTTISNARLYDADVQTLISSVVASEWKTQGSYSTYETDTTSPPAVNGGPAAFDCVFSPPVAMTVAEVRVQRRIAGVSGTTTIEVWRFRPSLGTWLRLATASIQSTAGDMQTAVVFPEQSDEELLPSDRVIARLTSKEAGTPKDLSVQLVVQ